MKAGNRKSQWIQNKEYEQTQKAINKLCVILIGHPNFCPQRQYEDLLGHSRLNHIQILMGIMATDQNYYPSKQILMSVLKNLNSNRSSIYLTYPGYLKLITTRDLPSSLNQHIHYRNTITSQIHKFKQHITKGENKLFHQLTGTILLLKCWQYENNNPQAQCNQYGLSTPNTVPKKQFEHKLYYSRHKSLDYAIRYKTAYLSEKKSTMATERSGSQILSYFQSDKNLQKNMSNKSLKLPLERTNDSTAFIQIPTTQKRIFSLRK